MRIVGGAWRGRNLTATRSAATRPTADRVRQALFDMLLHAQWGGRAALEGADVLDAFAGTGALGLEALSRGAARACFIEQDSAALAALRANIAACRAEAQCSVLAADATQPPPGRECALVFLDPPYGRQFVPRAIAALAEAGWIGAGALLIAETERAEPLPELGVLLADRAHGAARLTVWRHEEGLISGGRTVSRSPPATA
jgi:16S rRNA (guanine966-N2)-methyltransferase